MVYIKAMQENAESNSSNGNNIEKGKLQINVTSDVDSFPVSDAVVSVSYTGVPDSTLEELSTNSSGQTEEVELNAPPLEYSLDPEIEGQPYAEYTLDVRAPALNRSVSPERKSCPMSRRSRTYGSTLQSKMTPARKYL